MRQDALLKSLPHFLLLVLVSLLLLFSDNLGWLKLVRGGVELGAKPAKLFLYRGQQRLEEAFSFLTFWRSGEQKIKYLEERNLELLVEAQKASSLEKENRDLRGQLEISIPSEWKLTPAQTVGKGRYLTIDQGVIKGVDSGQVVILKKFLVGKIIKVNPYESLVELPADPESKIPARTAKTHAEGLLVGQFGKGMVLEKVTQGESLELEDTVLTTGEGGYPKGLIIGKINWVEKRESEVFQKAGVEPLLNIETLDLVFLLTEER